MDDKKNILIANIKNDIKKSLLTHDLANSEYPLFTPLDKSYKLIEHEIKKKLPTHYDNQAGRNEFFKIIDKALGHFAANPSEIGNILALESIYTFLDDCLEEDKKLKNGESNYLNQNKKTSQSFIDQLIEAAQLNRNLYHKILYEKENTFEDLSTDKVKVANRSRYFLLGEKGSGKTIYLNYLLSQYNKYFEDNRIIWIRLDYTKTVDKYINIEDWLRWQFCQVLFRYYDSYQVKEKELRFDISGENHDLYLRIFYRNPSVEKEEFSAYLTKLKAEINSQIAPSKIDAWFFHGLYDYLVLNEKIGLIFIVDGLDRLGLTSGEGKDFKRKFNDLRTYLLSEETYLAVYLITMRTESYHRYAEGIPYREYFMTYYIGKADTYKIYTNRIKYVECKDVHPLDGLPMSKGMSNNEFKFKINEICGAFLKFVSHGLTYSLKNNPDQDVRGAFNILDSIFGGDIRLLMDSLRIVLRYFFFNLNDRIDDFMEKAVNDEIIQEFLDSPPLDGVKVNVIEKDLEDLFKKSYMVTEALMLKGYYFYQPRYLYRVKIKNGNENIKIKRILNSSEDLLYNIYRHPYHPEETNNIFALSGIRILQYFLLKNRRASKQMIIKAMKLYFRYPSYIVKAHLKEMFEANILKSHISPANIATDVMELAEKGEYMYQQVVKSLEYIYISFQGVPLPSIVFGDDSFKLYKYGTDEYYKNKVLAGIKIAKILCDIEAYEKKCYLEYQSMLEHEELLNGDFDNNFSIAIAIRKEIEKSLIGIINSAYRYHHTKTYSELERIYLSENIE